MINARRRTAFTLIELLTVIAIITLLIGILTPSLGRARDEAKKAAIKAQLQSIATGLEMFQNDQGKYPASNAGEYSGFDAASDFEVGTSSTPLQGANLLVDAMVGRDFLGYDPNPTRQASGSSPAYNRWVADNQRREKYIDPSGIGSSRKNKSVADSFGPLGATPAADSDACTPTIDGAYCPIFTDKFDWPVLYYRSNPSANNRSWILPDGWLTATNAAKNNAFYNGLDNRVFTEHAAGTSPGQFHEISRASVALTGADDLSNNFADFIRSFRSSTVNPGTGAVTFLRPVNPDKFILLTPGKDGIFGNLDDVSNFAVKSEER